MIRTQNLSKRFGHRMVLQGVDLQVRPGEIIALLGPNGAGKSTLLRILATLTRPTAGEAQVAGFDIAQQSTQARTQLGFVGHQPLLYEDLSAEQNLSFYARLYGIRRAEKRAAELLALFDLQTRGREPLRTFSRGMQQRLAVARAVLHRPKVLLLDEPYSALDKEASATVDKLLRNLAKQGCAILLATHDMNRALSLAKRVDILAGGRLVASLAARQLSQKRMSTVYGKALRTARRSSYAG